MITQKQVTALRDIKDVDWLTALRPEAIRKLVKDESVQIGLFDERNLFELTHPDWPDERLVACRNPALAERRKAKRESLLQATVDELERVRLMVSRGRLRGKEDIERSVNKILGRYKIGRHYATEIREDGFDCKLNREALDEEISTGAGADKKIATQRRERFERHVATINEKLGKLKKRIEHGQLHGKAKIGVRVGKVVNKYKVAKHFELTIQDDSPVHSFKTLLDHLGKIVRNTCRYATDGEDAPTFFKITSPNKTQQAALDLLGNISF
jgi:hypothetical protein